MNVKPLSDRVVIRPLDAEEMTSSGLYLPDQAQERPHRGTVIAVGPGLIEDGARIPMDLAEGDEVVYSRYGGTEVLVDGEELVIMRQSDVLAKDDGK